MKIDTQPRKFHEVVSDLRKAVFTVIRDRPNATGGIDSAALGSGFFVREDVFITCHHVMNPPAAPHVAGDSYRLIANIGATPSIHTVSAPQVGKELSLFPDIDLAVLLVANTPNQHYLAIDYGDMFVGEDLGVVGYPLASLSTDAAGNLVLDGLIYRAGRGVVTGRFQVDITGSGNNLPAIEVNFMFVSGNSGGPAFNPETGKALGMVQGFRWFKLAEQLMQANLPQQLPLGIGPNYFAPILAFYSHAIKLDCFKTVLDGFGIGG